MFNFLPPSQTPPRPLPLSRMQRKALDSEFRMMRQYAIGIILLFAICTIIAFLTPETASGDAIPSEPVEYTKAPTTTTHREIVGPKYTIRVGLSGARKPIPTITQTTTESRAREFLDIHNIGESLPSWKSLGEQYKIDYTLPICIAWADSHLGGALKSKNNIGNVGNNDRGDVVHFATLDDGIKAIFSTIAQGKYMRGHTTIATLSGEGRIRSGAPGCTEERDSTKKCYATSTNAWSSNVTNCLSIIHDTQINEQYAFRT